MDNDVISMMGSSKILAVMLVLLAVFSSALALPACSSSAPPSVSEMNCPPGCPMMASQSAMQDMNSGRTMDGSCCQFSSGSPAPAPVAQAAVQSGSAQSAPAHANVVLPAVVRIRERITSVEVRTPEVRAQAVLCSFLI